jgi:hypothetical protein
LTIVPSLDEDKIVRLEKLPNAKAPSKESALVGFFEAWNEAVLQEIIDVEKFCG